MQPGFRIHTLKVKTKILYSLLTLLPVPLSLISLTPHWNSNEWQEDN
jgi:hypothetical protein